MARQRLKTKGESGPFGAPDGARGDWEEIRNNFVDFADLDETSDDDLATLPDDRSARLIVGKKGVGKTVYLRRFHADAKQDRGLYAVDVEHRVPATEDVIKVCNFYPPKQAAEGWQMIWRRAIMRSLASHLLRTPALRDRIDREHLQALESPELGRCLGTIHDAFGIYAEAGAIAAETRSKDSLRELRSREWIQIENLLSKVLVTQPPICFYLDSVDEQFGTAPVYWLQCQKGLFNEVLELNRDQRFNHLHIVVSIRDLVRSSLLRDEHATRYIRVPHIRVLDWEHASIKYLLHEKIRRFEGNLLMDRSQTGVRGWLGRDELYNESRGVHEKLEDYLLRHTRQIPRDVVQLGNELSSAVERSKAKGDEAVDDQEIRSAVGTVSKEFADEQIAVCANHLASDYMPSDAAQWNASEFYTSSEYSQPVQNELCRFIKAVGTDRFTMGALEEALTTTGGDVLRNHSNPLDVLWLNGLLGYDAREEDDDRSHFYGAHDIPDFELPRDRESYVFHPIVGHKIGIEAAGDKPVRPFR
jgi:hypothetical protein